MLAPPPSANALATCRQNCSSCCTDQPPGHLSSPPAPALLLPWMTRDFGGALVPPGSPP